MACGEQFQLRKPSRPDKFLNVKVPPRQVEVQTDACLGGNFASVSFVKNEGLPAAQSTGSEESGVDCWTKISIRGSIIDSNLFVKLKQIQIQNYGKATYF